MEVIHGQEVAAPCEAEEVFQVAAVITVIERHPGRAYPFVLQDYRDTLACAVGGVGVDTNGHARRLAGSRRRPQSHFFERGRTSRADPYLDHARFEGRAIDASIDFLREMFGETFDLAGR